jgi:Tfp pilus assembly protein PilO
MRLDSNGLRNSLKLNTSHDPRSWAPALLVTLAALNLIAAWFVWQPPGGSAVDLEDQVAAGQAQVQRAAANLGRLRGLVKKVETARSEQNQFVMQYFMDRRTASSTILSELGSAATQAGLTPKEHSFTFEPVEGSDVFTMMSIAANYEGRYSDLRQFITSLDRSERFLIIEDVTAAPQQEPGKLTARFKINAFVRESGRAAIEEPAEAASAAPDGAGAAGASLKLAERRR